VLAPAPQAIGANSHNTDYGISLTANHQGAARPARAAATYNRFAEFPSLGIAGCATSGARLTKREFILSNCLQPASQQRLYRAPAVPSLRSILRGTAAQQGISRGAATPAT
jgi:hypothetical protein